jgi:hypothetical protein
MFPAYTNIGTSFDTFHAMLPSTCTNQNKLSDLILSGILNSPFYIEQIVR